MILQSQQDGEDCIDVFLAMTSNDVDRLIRNLQRLRADPTWHFHLTRNVEMMPGWLDIEFSYQGPDEEGSADVTGIP